MQAGLIKRTLIKLKPNWWKKYLWTGSWRNNSWSI